MSFYHLPHPWDPGFVIPEYVMAEPPERGTFTTQWLPRGTISELVPDYFAKPGKQLLGRTDAELGSLGGNTLRGSTLGDDIALTHEPVHVSTTPAPAATGMSPTTRKVVAVAGVAVLAYLAFGRKRRGR
jgi:hypothetical protein